MIKDTRHDILDSPKSKRKVKQICLSDLLGETQWLCCTNYREYGWH